MSFATTACQRSWIAAGASRTTNSPPSIRGLAVDPGRLKGLAGRRRAHDKAAGRHANALADAEIESPALGAHREIELAVGRTQIANLHTLALRYPGPGDAGGDHQGAVALAVVGAAVEHRPHVVRAHPLVRQVADEVRLTLGVPHDLGPLAPADRFSVLEEPVVQLLRALSPAQAHEGADVADLVGRERVPFQLAGLAIGKILVIALEGLLERRLRQVRLHGLQCDRRGGGVEVA